jgi:hypothetical protein
MRTLSQTIPPQSSPIYRLLWTEDWAQSPHLKKFLSKLHPCISLN